MDSVAAAWTWCLEHPKEVGLVVSIVLALIAGKKAWAKDIALQLLTQENEGPEGKATRRRVGALADTGAIPADAASEIKNAAAMSDPDRDKRFSVKEALKPIVPNLVRGFIGRIFRGG
jgi:hypothetical protein